jgi:NAD(P)-dependent dehydrogenase (short-subunit alcohol dehydrogenase family)
VIGASGAVGGALLERLRNDDGFAHVVGFSRAGIPSLDLASETSIASAARHVSRFGTPVRVIIDATGFLHGDGVMPEKTWRQLDAAHLAKAFAINAIGPALLIKHLLPLLPRTGKAAFATLSARVGSIGDNHLGGWYGYRASKAALNQLVRTAAIELKRRHPEAVCVALHPGTVDSRLSAPFGKGGLAVRSPAEAAGLLLEVIGRMLPADSGGFFDYRGERLPW